jgi:hypothetical protein
MAEGQQALSRVILKDPVVESLSSFIGVDSTCLQQETVRIVGQLRHWLSLEELRTATPKPSSSAIRGLSSWANALQACVTKCSGITDADGICTGDKPIIKV